MTVMEIINEVQRRMRLPQSSSLADAHAKLLLTFMNEVQRDHMMEGAAWDELKVYGNLNTVDGTATYAVTLPSSGEIDSIRNLQIGTSDPIGRLDDEEFRAYRRANTSEGQPLRYRIYSRSGGSVTIEFSPVPDAAYQVDYELLKKPSRLTAAGDVPLLDEDTIILGVTMLARKDQGEDFTGDLAAYQSKMGLQKETQGESNWGDVEAV